MQPKSGAIDELEPLRPIDPEVGVEPCAATPQPRDLRVPAFVRGQRRVKERDAQSDSERRRRPEWGPPRDLDLRTALLVASSLAVASGLAIWLNGLNWTPDRALLVLLVPSLVLRRPWQYVRDFVPFAGAIFLYAELRGLAHSIAPHPHYLPQIRLERGLFGTPIPTVALQHALWTGHLRWYDGVASSLLQLHFVAPPLLAYALWLRRRALFYRFAAAMLLLSFAGALTFIAYPAAPPWAASQIGDIGHVLQLPLAHPIATSATALSSSRLSLGFLVPRNPYAAIPSLHAGYAFLIALFVAHLALRLRTRFRYALASAAFVYPLLQSFAVIYTGNHYVVDIIAGFVFAAAALIIVDRLWRRLDLAA